MGARALGSHTEGAGPRAGSGMETSQSSAWLKGWAGTGLHCLPQPPTLASHSASPAVLSSGSCLCQIGGGVNRERALGKDDSQGGGE